MFFNIFNSTIDNISNDILIEKSISLSVLRLDKIHPVVSGNKLFKLHYFLEQAQQSPHRTILTFGGAFSNHLVATAFATQQLGLKSIAIVRGERPPELSPTLNHCLQYGMQLHFISREHYRQLQLNLDPAQLGQHYGPHILVPEGGYHPTGALGASIINTLIQPQQYTHIVTALGTATTAAGLLLGNPGAKIVLIPVLKNMTDIDDRLQFLCGEQLNKERIHILDGYHFGGYAKQNDTLIQFMNDTWQQHHIPTDFVYTGKMLFAIMDQIKADQFEKGSSILCLHTGGLQGNASLPAGTLLF